MTSPEWPKVAADDYRTASASALTKKFLQEVRMPASGLVSVTVRCMRLAALGRP